MAPSKTLIRTVAGVALTLAGLATAALYLSARRLGISTRSQFARVVVLPILFRADGRGHDAMDALVAEDRAKGPAEPPNGLRKRFVVGEEAVEGYRVWTVSPRRPDTGLRILFLHGGAYVYEMAPYHWDIVEGLVARTGARVMVPLYPLAPEHDWQAGHALARQIYDRLAAEAGPGNVAIVGDSAGGGFSLALAQTLRDAGRPLPAALVLLSPWLDATCSDPAQPELEKKDRILSIEALRRAGSLWAWTLPPADPRISPLYGSLSGLPPIAVFTSTEDLLLPDARRLGEKGRAEGAEVTVYEYPHQFHGWMGGAPNFVPEARRALDQAAAFILLRAK